MDFKSNFEKKDALNMGLNRMKLPNFFHSKDKYTPELTKNNKKSYIHFDSAVKNAKMWTYDSLKECGLTTLFYDEDFTKKGCSENRVYTMILSKIDTFLKIDQK